MMHALQLGTYSIHLGYSRNPILGYSISSTFILCLGMLGLEDDRLSFSVIEASKIE